MKNFVVVHFYFRLENCTRIKSPGVFRFSKVGPLKRPNKRNLLLKFEIHYVLIFGYNHFFKIHAEPSSPSAATMPTVTIRTSAIFASTVESAGLLQEARIIIKGVISNFIEDFIFLERLYLRNNIFDDLTPKLRQLLISTTVKIGKLIIIQT